MPGWPARVTPDPIFQVDYTAYMIVIVVIGGIGSIEGPILGAVIHLLRQELQDKARGISSSLGVVAIGAVLLVPRGLWGLVPRDGRLQPFPVGHRVRL